MPLSDRAVIKGIVPGMGVLEYVPQRIPHQFSATISKFKETQTKSSGSFEMNSVLAEQTGLKAESDRAVDDEIEKRVLARLTELQEDAYSKGYELGREEGHKLAYEEQTESIKNSVEQLEVFFDSIQNLKTQLYAANERHFLETLRYLTNRLAMREIALNETVILDVLKQSVSLAQSDEEFSVRVNQEQFVVIEKFRELLEKESDKFGKMRVLVDPTISPGGCILDTNFGRVDAQIENRMEKLWRLIEEVLPEQKDNFSSSSTGQDD